MEGEYILLLTQQELRYIMAAINIYKYEGSTSTYGAFGDKIQKKLVEQASTDIEGAWENGESGE